MSIINQESIECTENHITIAGISYVFTKYNDKIFNSITLHPNKLFFSKNRNQCNKLDTEPAVKPKYLALDSKIFEDVYDNDNIKIIFNSIFQKTFSYDVFNLPDDLILYSTLESHANTLKNKIDDLIQYLIFQEDLRNFDLIEFDNFVSEIANFRELIIIKIEKENYDKFLEKNKEIFENLYFYIFRPFTYLNNLNNKNYNINFDETSAIFLNDLVELSAISQEEQYTSLCTTHLHEQHPVYDVGSLNHKFDTLITAQNSNNVIKFGFNNYNNSCWWDSCMFILFTPNKKYSIFNLLNKNEYFQSKLCEDKELEQILVNALISFYNKNKKYSYIENRLLIDKIGFDLDRIRMGFAEDSLSKFFRDLIYEDIYTSVYLGYEIKSLYFHEYLTVSKNRSNFKEIKWDTNNNFHIEFENFISNYGILQIDLGLDSDSIIIDLENYDLIGLIIWKGYHFTAYAKYLDQDDEENWYYHNDLHFYSPRGSNKKVTQANPGNLADSHYNSVFTLFFKRKNY